MKSTLLSSRKPLVIMFGPYWLPSVIKGAMALSASQSCICFTLHLELTVPAHGWQLQSIQVSVQCHHFSETVPDHLLQCNSHLWSKISSCPFSLFLPPSSLPSFLPSYPLFFIRWLILFVTLDMRCHIKHYVACACEGIIFFLSFFFLL